jgi:hypothetical protein
VPTLGSKDWRAFERPGGDSDDCRSDDREACCGWARCRMCVGSCCGSDILLGEAADDVGSYFLMNSGLVVPANDVNTEFLDIS